MHLELLIDCWGKAATAPVQHLQSSRMVVAGKEMFCNQDHDLNQPSHLHANRPAATAAPGGARLSGVAQL